MRKMDTKIRVIFAIISVLIFAMTVGGSNIALAESDIQHWWIGHHEGALQASIDEQTGYYNSECYRYTPGSHTNAYCNGYGVGYDVNWHIFKARNLHLGNFNSKVQASQNINQKSQIYCFLAICNNHVNQRAIQEQNVGMNTANSGN
jgi:hypothetical protein